MAAIGATFRLAFARHANQIGIAATYARQSDGTYNTATGTATATQTTANVKGFFDFTTGGRFQADAEIGRDVRERTFLIPAMDVNLTVLAFAPTAQDKITINSEVFRISKVEPEYAAELVVYYRLFLGKV